MSTNNHMVLTGHLGADPKEVQVEDKCFVAFSIATQGRYQDKENEWVSKPSVWHRVAAFNESIVDITQKLEKGMRIKVKGSLSYRSFEALLEDDKSVKKQEATIIAYHIEQAPLSKSPA